MTSTEKLVAALERAKAPPWLIDQARNDCYNDYRSPSATPIMDLVHDANIAGLTDIGLRAKAGEFDATSEEGEAWAAAERAKGDPDMLRVLDMIESTPVPEAVAQATGADIEAAAADVFVAPEPEPDA